MTDALQVDYKTPDWVTSCETCKAVWRRLTSGDTFKHTISLGSYKDASPAQCPHFQPIVKALYEYSQDENGNDMSREVRIDFDTRGYAITLDETVDYCGYRWNLSLIQEESVSNHPGTARVLDSKWADLAVLSTWKDTCTSSHGASCQNPLKIWHTRPAWLIDVEQKCLIPGNVEGNYVALSYTYGNHMGLVIDASILDMLQVPDALESSNFSGHRGEISMGRRNMHHSRRSRVNYSTTEFNGRAIYANAILTIIAADGDSLTGLAGIKGISAARQLKQGIIPFGDQKLLRHETFGLEAEYYLPYYERGWIYQEMRLSTRKIVFHEEQLHWMCPCSVWHEEFAQKFQLERDSGSQTSIDSSMRILIAGFFDWSVFSLLVSRYNDMTFRYDEDALPAISGFLSVLSRRFKGGFLYGIPEMMFERGLGWKPWLESTNVQRRIRSSRSQEIQLKPSGLPSWSWIGWSGTVGPGYKEATLMARGYDELEETTPITEWYTSNSPADPPELWRRIRSTWHEDRDSYKDFTKPLPPGWTRHKAPEKSTWNDGPHISPDGCDEYIFRHESMPVDELDLEEGHGWYYPFPIMELDESTLPDMPEQTEYLFCKTKKAQLWGVQKVGERKDALLYNSQKQEVGFLNLVNDDYLARFPKAMTDEEGGISVDLVAVCKIRTYSRTQDEVTEIWDKILTTKDTYLVLWVEWKDGIAYRLASGQVQVDKWDELDLEDISLILG
ncbi:hypothetical protein NXS19_012819 [Fusarium pseudograminearum]|nr:hypothetical protein NXS19_012819 [Fusarium pseudograminearum]